MIKPNSLRANPRAGGSPAHRGIPAKVSIAETYVQRTCTEMLVWDGWRPIRTDPVSDRSTVNQIRARLAATAALAGVLSIINAIIASCVRGKGFGEPGMCDYLYIRYGDTGRAEVLWVEYKRLGKKPRPDQVEWMEAERAKGATVTWTDSIEGLRDWYATSGLKRRPL